jgi:ribosomal-protein-alanine N-acetyltransferase
VLRTPRLILRDWRDDDLEPWTAMGRDREVMAFFPTVLSRAQSADALTRIREHLAREGFGFWAVEVIGGPRFIGFCGLGRPGFTAPFTPCVEIGWRLARAHWGQGYATEAARAALAFGFESLQLAEIVAFLVPSNVRSARVAERIGMHRDRDGDFDHPRITPGTVSVGGHPAQRHALYRIAGGRSASGEAARASRS